MNVNDVLSYASRKVGAKFLSRHWQSNPKSGTVVTRPACCIICTHAQDNQNKMDGE
jgi:hypothetical protein